MKINFTRNLFVLTLVLISSCFSAMALPGIQYNLTASTVAFGTIGAATTVIAGGVDEQLVGPISPAGFAVNFGGIRYTSFYVSSNGFMSFQNPGGAHPINDLSNAPSTLIAPLWDDMKTAAVGRVAWAYSFGTGDCQFTN